jgi:hypothetical protein
MRLVAPDPHRRFWRLTAADCGRLRPTAAGRLVGARLAGVGRLSESIGSWAARV